MGRLIGEHWEDDVKVSFFDNGDTVDIRYSQDIDSVLDRMSAINANGGVPSNEGIGRLLYEFPVTLIMEHAIERGISYEDLIRPGEDYEHEWHAMGRKWSKLTAEMKRKYMGVA